MFKNPFSKKKKEEIDPKKAIQDAESMMGGEMPEITDEMIDQMIAGEMPGAPKMNMMQRMALKRVKKLDPKQRKEMFAKAMSEKGGESKEDMASQIEEMRASGQLNSKQYKIAKKRLGIK